MPILQGKEAEEWLKQNPQAAYQNLDTGQEYNTNAPSNIFESLLKGIVSPLAGASRGLSEQTRQLAYETTPKLAGEQNVQSYQPKYLTGDEWGQYVENPLGKNVQDLATIASYAPIPGATGLKGAVASGAASGGLQSFGAQDLRKGVDLGDIATGAATGGLVGGALEGIGSKLSKLGKKGSKVATEAAQEGIRPIEQQLVGVADDAIPAGNIKNVDDFVQSMDDILKKPTSKARKFAKGGEIRQLKDAGITATGEGLNIPGSFGKKADLYSAALESQGLPKTTEGLGQLADDLGRFQKQALDNTELSVTVNDIINPKQLDKAARELTPVGAKFNKADFKKAVNDVLAEVSTSAGYNLDDIVSGRVKLGAVDLNKMKQATYEAAQTLRNKGAANVSVNDAAKAYLNKYASDTLFSASPQLRKVNQLFSQLFGDQKGMVRAFNTGLGGFNIASPVQSISNQILGLGRKATGRLQEAIGDVAAGDRGIGSLIPGLPGQIAESAAPIAGQLGQTITNPAVQRLATTAAVNAPTTVSPAEAQQPIEMGAAGMEQAAEPQALDRRSMAMELLRQGVPINQVGAYLDLFAPESPKMTAAMQQKRSAAGAANQALDIIRSGKIQTGTLQEPAYQIKKSLSDIGLGSVDPHEVEYRSQLALARTAVKNMFLGSSMSEKEIQSLLAAIPSESESPQNAAIKLQGFVQLLSS